jgi:hypothetical protein
LQGYYLACVNHLIISAILRRPRQAITLTTSAKKFVAKFDLFLEEKDNHQEKKKIDNQSSLAE